MQRVVKMTTAVSREGTISHPKDLIRPCGLITQVGLCPIQVHDLPACRLFSRPAGVANRRFVIGDRGFLMAQRSRLLKQQRHVDVIVPLKSKMLSYTEAVQLASCRYLAAHPHETTSTSPLSKAWITCGRMSECPQCLCDSLLEPEKGAVDHTCLGHHRSRLSGSWIVRHYAKSAQRSNKIMSNEKWRLAAQKAEFNTATARSCFIC